MKTKNIFASIVFLLIVLISSTPFVYAGDSRAVDVGMASEDMTIYRTVNTLSCHPQNPLLHEVPHYTIFLPNKTYGYMGARQNEIKGACWAYHNEGNTNFISEDPGQVGLKDSEDEKNIRPASPAHHYHVFEVPNPRYDPDCEQKVKSGQLTGAAAFCGKYLHTEGYAFMFNLTVNDVDWRYPYPNSIQGNEVWYIGNTVGNQTWGGKNIIDVIPVGTAGMNPVTGRPYTVFAGRIIRDNKTLMEWDMCKSGSLPKTPVRLGDFRELINDGTDIYCDMKPEINIMDTPEEMEIFGNPFAFPDIPHNRFTRNPRNLAAQGDGGSYRVKEWFNDDLESHDLDPVQSEISDISRDNNDDNWVKCKEKYPELFNKYKDTIFDGKTVDYRTYIKKFIEYRRMVREQGDPKDATFRMPIASYTPIGCDYQPLIEQYPDGNAGPKPTTQAEFDALLNNWVNDNGNTTPTPSQYLPGDVNLDHAVNITDYNLMMNAIKTSRTTPYDTNNNGQVDIFDYNIVIRNFGRTN